MADINSNLPVSGTSMPAWTGIGSTLITNAAIPVSGTNLAGSVAITSSVALVQTGSVAITSSAILGISGQGISTGASGTDANFVFHPLRTGSATAGVPALLLTETLGSVAISSSVALTQTGSVAITSSVVLGVSGITLAGSFALTGQPITQTGSVAITSSASLPVTAPNGSILFDNAAAVAAGGSASHYYSAPAAGVLVRVICSASGRAKWTLQESGTNTVLATAFNSTATPSTQIEVQAKNAGAFIYQVVKRNDDGAAQDVQSAIVMTY